MSRNVSSCSNCCYCFGLSCFVIINTYKWNVVRFGCMHRTGGHSEVWIHFESFLIYCCFCFCELFPHSQLWFFAVISVVPGLFYIAASFLQQHRVEPTAGTRRPWEVGISKSARCLQDHNPESYTIRLAVLFIFLLRSAQLACAADMRVASFTPWHPSSTTPARPTAW